MLAAHVAIHHTLFVKRFVKIVVIKETRRVQPTM